MSESNDRPRGAMGYPLDSEKLKLKLREAINPDTPIDQWHALTAVLVYGDDKSWAVVNTEGVGSYADDYDGGADVWFSYAHGRLDCEKLSFTDVQDALTVNAAPVDLADFIRTFGARLDNNHALWFNFATVDLDEAIQYFG